mmetsp:Transcript_54341/g.172595  ORF Transcript_54341/g.172595 Transcript_54341/m.172595 type:complete len:201 (-) Transcript_54341:187-789(-)
MEDRIPVGLPPLPGRLARKLLAVVRHVAVHLGGHHGLPPAAVAAAYRCEDLDVFRGLKGASEPAHHHLAAGEVKEGGGVALGSRCLPPPPRVVLLASPRPSVCPLRLGNRRRVGQRLAVVLCPSSPILPRTHLLLLDDVGAHLDHVVPHVVVRLVGRSVLVVVTVARLHVRGLITYGDRRRKRGDVDVPRAPRRRESPKE